MGGWVYKIFVINPGSTSTKVALFQDEDQRFEKDIHHSTSSLASFNTVNEQLDYRISLINEFMDAQKIALSELDAIVARGGLLQPIPSGTYIVDDDILTDVRNARFGEHASNLGAQIAFHYSRLAKKPAYIVDPVVVDELMDVARITGHPLMKRKSIFHALNHKAVGREAAKRLGKSYDAVNLIVAHLGGGISIGAHKNGNVVDVNNALDGDGPFSPERAGTLPTGDLVRLCFSGDYSKEEILKSLKGNGGLVALLGTNDLREIIQKINEQNDQYAKLIYEAMAYQIAKGIGALAAVLQGKVDAILLTGGITHDKNLVKLITDFISFIAPIIVIPGQEELKALAQGGLRVLRGEEQAKRYKENILSLW